MGNGASPFQHRSDDKPFGNPPTIKLVSFGRTDGGGPPGLLKLAIQADQARGFTPATNTELPAGSGQPRPVQACSAQAMAEKPASTGAG